MSQRRVPNVCESISSVATVEIACYQIPFSAVTTGQRLIERIGTKWPQSPRCILKGPEDVATEGTRVAIPTNASLQLLSEFVTIVQPTRQKGIMFKPIIDCIADEFHQFLFGQEISILGKPDESNADDIPQSPVASIPQSNENI